MDVADQARHLRAVGIAPRVDREGGEIRDQEHVRLLDPDEALDRRAVEHDLSVERLAELARRHLDVLQHADDVGELQAQKADVFLLHDPQNLSSSCHTVPPELNVWQKLWDKLAEINPKNAN